MPHEKCVRISHRRCGQSANQGEGVCLAKGEAHRPDVGPDAPSRASTSGWAEIGTDYATAFYASYGEYLAERQASTVRWSIESQREFHEWARHGGKQPRSPDA
jgi:hypothetical protein